MGSLGSLGSLGWGGTLRELDGSGPWHSCCCAVDQVGLLLKTVRRADYARIFGLDVGEVSKLGGSSGMHGHAVKLPQIVRATSHDESRIIRASDL